MIDATRTEDSKDDMTWATATMVMFSFCKLLKVGSNQYWFSQMSQMVENMKPHNRSEDFWWYLFCGRQGRSKTCMAVGLLGKRGSLSVWPWCYLRSMAKKSSCRVRGVPSIGLTRSFDASGGGKILERVLQLWKTSLRWLRCLETCADSWMCGSLGHELSRNSLARSILRLLQWCAPWEVPWILQKWFSCESFAKDRIKIGSKQIGIIRHQGLWMVRLFFSSFSRSGCDGHGSHGSGADGPKVFHVMLT